MRQVTIGKTDFSVEILILDDTGAPATGLVAADVDMAYARLETDNDVASTDGTPVDLTALTDPHTDWGMKEVSATDHPGLYRVDIPDAAFATGAWCVVFSIVGTGLHPAQIQMDLVGFDPQALDVYGVKAFALDKNTSTATDRYGFIFTKNGGDVLAGVTSPTLQVIKGSDGTDLIAETALTAVGSTGFFKHDETTNRFTPGELYFVVVKGTIDGAVRQSSWPSIGRDAN